MSGKKNYNPGNVNLEALKSSFTNNGGTVESKPNGDGSTHYTGHFNDKGRTDRCSWDVDSDGNVSNLHTTRDNGAHTNYKGGY